MGEPLRADEAWVTALLHRHDPGAPIERLDRRHSEATPTRAQVWGTGSVVAKLHAEPRDADAADTAAQVSALTNRLAVAADPVFAGVLLRPLTTEVLIAPSGRLVTLWPRVETVPEDDPDEYPWAAVGAVLAQLHSAKVPERSRLPAVDPLPRAEWAVRRLPHGPERQLLSNLLDDLTLPPAPTNPVVVHGDVHLGQLGTLRGLGGIDVDWVLLDVDDLALGDPVCDFARLGAFWATGLLATQEWAACLSGYRAVAPAGLPDDAALWDRLDPWARVALVSATARVLGEGADADATERLLDACARIRHGSG